MAPASFVTAFLFTLVLARAEAELPTTVLKGMVTCLDCTSLYDLSGIVVMAKCDKVTKLVIATTKKDGSFETDELPVPAAAPNCVARLSGGPSQLYAAKNSIISKIVKANDGSNAYATASPLAFSTACHSLKCKATATKFGSSKTVDLPLPPEWGLAPSSYYVPFFPIIGVP